MSTVLAEIGNLKALEIRKRHIEASAWTDKGTVENILMRSKDLTQDYSKAAENLYNAWSADYKDSEGRVFDLIAEVKALKKKLSAKVKRESRPLPEKKKPRSYFIANDVDMNGFQRFPTQEEAKKECISRMAVNGADVNLAILSMVAQVKISWD